MFTIIRLFCSRFRETSLVVLKGRLFRPPVRIFDVTFRIVGYGGGTLKHDLKHDLNMT